MNKEFNRMLKLAGLMTEGLYTSDEKAPMEGMSSGKMKKSELKAKIKEMMLSEETPEEMAYAEMGSMDEASPEGMNRMSELAPIWSVKSFLKAAWRIIYVLKEEGFEEDDIYDYLIDKVRTVSIDETLFEAKKDEESDTEDVIVADTEEEVPAEGGEGEVATDTQVDVNMDGIPDVDTGSAESKKAFTGLVDAYNSAKELGDPKLTQILANALTYYNKNIILKTGQQA